MGKPGMLQFVGLQGVGHDLEAEQQQCHAKEHGLYEIGKRNSH